MNRLLKLALFFLTIPAMAQNSLSVPVNGPALPGTVPTQGVNGIGSWQLPPQPGSQNTNSGVAPGGGCGVEYTGTGLVYTIGACSYFINGQPYSISSPSTVTLPASDPSNPEIDSIIVDITGTASAVAGTPATNPQLPTVDNSTQLPLTFVLVAATATTPSNTTVVNIYQEGAGSPTEWVGAVGGTNSARVNLTSTNNPYQGTHDTEFGNGGTVTTTTFAGWTVPSSGTVTLSNYNTLTFYLRNKAAWVAKRSISIQFFSGATPLGIAVPIGNNSYGLNTVSNFTTYQQVSIPVSSFGIPGVTATSMRVTVTGSGTALTGFYIDDVTLQGGTGSVTLPTTLMNFKGVYSTTATYNPNDEVVNSTGTGYVALVQNTNTPLTTTAVWQPLSPSAASGTFTAHQFYGNNTGSTAAPIASLLGASDVSPPSYAAGGGSVNVMTATLSPAATALVAGLEVNILPNLANTTTTPTLNVSGLGAKTIKKNGTSALAAGDYTTTAIANFIYDGTNWQLQNPQITAITYPSATFYLNSGAAATPATNYFNAVTPGTISHCYFTTTTSDASTNLVFNVKFNGANILSGTNATVTAATSAKTVSTFNLTSATISIVQGQQWEFDISTGAADWTGVAQCY